MNAQELPELIQSFLISEGRQENFRERLFPVILELLLNNTTHLYQVLYRIDVKEEKVKNAFVDNPMIEVAAERITTLIIERQLEKIQWRKKYSL